MVVFPQDGPLYVLVEYAEHGNLRDFLRSFHGGLSVRGETSFSTQQNFTPQRDEDGYEKPKSSAELEKTKISCRQLMSFAWQVGLKLASFGSSAIYLYTTKWYLNVRSFPIRR